jgi:hypothetical protein
VIGSTSPLIAPNCTAFMMPTLLHLPPRKAGQEYTVCPF